MEIWRHGEDRQNLKPELPDFKYLVFVNFGIKIKKKKLQSIFIEGKVIIDLLL